MYDCKMHGVGFAYPRCLEMAEVDYLKPLPCPVPKLSLFSDSVVAVRPEKRSRVEKKKGVRKRGRKLVTASLPTGTGPPGSVSASNVAPPLTAEDSSENSVWNEDDVEDEEGSETSPKNSAGEVQKYEEPLILVDD